jgi:uncharacterized membrane protein YsdA (DUF1294 family)
MGSVTAFLSDHISWIFGMYLVSSVAGYICMGLDKSRARKNTWRIPERTLLSLAFFGGAAGILLGMQIFRHKTKHARFLIVGTLSLVIQLIFLACLMFN